MELGLFDEAEEKFSRAMDSGDDEMLPLAAYGCGAALFSMAQRDNQDGKAGSAYALLQQGVQGCHKLSDRTNVCVQKLLGDLHTFGAALPPDVFGEMSGNTGLENDEALLRSQFKFISNGKDAYHHALSLVDGSGEASDALRASLGSDGGSNLLMQAQLLSGWESKGLHQPASPESSELFESAAAEFRRALELCPTYAPAWCGLGCAAVRSDPLLAQHAFSRSLELDNLAPDPYANLSFLYTAHRRFSVSARVSDALTEVADTPMMWINLAMILELRAAAKPGEQQSRHDMMQAADAYRAAMQVFKHPSAMLGLALTCRMSIDDDHTPDTDAMVIESHSYTSEYLGMVGRFDLPTLTIDGVLKMETGITNPSEQSKQLIDEGRHQVLEGISQFVGQHLLDDQNNALDQDVFRQVTVVDDGCRSGNGDSNSSIEATEEWSLDRQVVHHPNRGDLWMQLSKQLVCRGASTEPALLAARRATSILMQQLQKTLSMPTKSPSHFVKAQDLSDALALRHWLETVARPEEAIAPLSTIDLQRSLLICPGNSLARDALKSFV
jgi:tetratricopeptide (TPR) repeat protein